MSAKVYGEGNKTMRDYPTLRCKKEDAKLEGYTHSLVFRDYIYLSKSASYIDMLEIQKRVIAGFYPGATLTTVINAAYAKTIQTVFEEVEDMTEYRKLYNKKEFDDIPENIKNALDTEAITLKNNERRRWQTELRVKWLPEFKELGYEDFIKEWGHHNRIDEILEYCEKNAQISDLVMSQACDSTSQQLNSMLTSLAKEYDAMSLADITTACVNEGIMPSKEDDLEGWADTKNILKVLGSNLGLSKNKLGRGIWNLKPLQNEVVNK